MSYLWARYTWQQSRDQHGQTRQHVHDAQLSNAPVAVGQEFTALCGRQVRPSNEDFRPGACFAPSCQWCVVLLAHAQGWQPSELGLLAGRFEWKEEQVADLLKRFAFNKAGRDEFERGMGLGRKESQQFAAERAKAAPR
jgi:hypothetical protein